MNTYNFVPSTVDSNQFIAYKQPGAYMTDYRPSSDNYAFLINSANKQGVMTSHQLRKYLQDNGETFMNNFMGDSYDQFINLKAPNGVGNACSGAEESIIYSGGNQLINSKGITQLFPKDCLGSGEYCSTNWVNTPLPQQGSHCKI